MTASSPAAILFDLDGTLIDTWRLYMECYRRSLEPHLGYTPTDSEIAARSPGSERRLLTGWIGEAAGAAGHAEMRRLYAQHFVHLWDGRYEGVPEMLQALRTAGYPLGIVTGKGREAWETTQTCSGLGPFDVVVTDDDVHASKPDPAGLLAAADALGIAPARAVYIGDSTADLEAGRNAGMRVGAVLWPKTAPGERDAFLRAIEGDGAGVDLRSPGRRDPRLRRLVLIRKERVSRRSPLILCSSSSPQHSRPARCPKL